MTPQSTHHHQRRRKRQTGNRDKRRVCRVLVVIHGFTSALLAFVGKVVEVPALNGWIWMESLTDCHDVYVEDEVDAAPPETLDERKV